MVMHQGGLACDSDDQGARLAHTIQSSSSNHRAAAPLSVLSRVATVGIGLRAGIACARRSGGARSRNCWRLPVRRSVRGDKLLISPSRYRSHVRVGATFSGRWQPAHHCDTAHTRDSQQRRPKLYEPAKWNARSSRALATDSCPTTGTPLWSDARGRFYWTFGPRTSADLRSL